MDNQKNCNFGGQALYSRTVVAAAVLAFLFLPETSPAHAGIIDISASQADATTGQGNFTGTLEYFADSIASTTGTLIVTLTNTTNPALGGWLTGFLFDINSDANKPKARLLSSPSPTHPFKRAKRRGLKGRPFGRKYDGGAALGGRYLGGDSPTGGIFVGETGIFYFTILASDAGLLDAIDFIQGGDYEFNFITRFKGMDGPKHSDKVPAAVVVMPLPAPFALGALGLLGVITCSRRVRRP